MRNTAKKIIKNNKEFNKKVRNATRVECDGIKFRSKLEVFAYKHLKANGLDFRYEEFTSVLLSKFTNNVRLFEPNREKDLKEYDVSYNAMTYTPDFVYENSDLLIVIETKGRPNEQYPLKKKLFLHKIGLTGNKQVIFIEPHTQKQVLQAIDIIKNLIKK